MVTKKPKVVIIGAGMAGLTAANKLYSTAGSKELFELCVVEGGNRIGGRIKTSEFGGSKIEMGATWIHGIGGSPVYKIAQDINSLESEQPWECMDEFLDEPLTIAEGGYELNPSLVEPISNLFKNLMELAQGKVIEDGVCSEFAGSYRSSNCCIKNLSVGSFLREGLDAYWGSMKDQEEVQGCDNWSRKSLEEGIFAMLENTQRTYTSADDLQTLDFNAESEYRMFPDKEITIAKGYSSIVQSLASILPAGLIQLGRKVMKIEWQPDEGGYHQSLVNENGDGTTKPVKLHFNDGSIMYADHVIVTVSLGVLKRAVRQEDSGMFNPPLPSFKTEAISRLGFGVVNKLFLQLSPTNDEKDSYDAMKFPYLQMVFHQSDPKLRHPKIPWWMRRTSSLCPIYGGSNVLLSWFVGKEALELESLGDEEIVDGISTTMSNFLVNSKHLNKPSSNGSCNGHANSAESFINFDKVLRSQWGTDPLFLGSYSYVAVGSSGDDLDAMAEPLPKRSNDSCNSKGSPPVHQILFAGEATHRTHYSTTHGAYFSGLREANRLLQHYHRIDI